jgi:hypothetical protein
VNKTNRLALVVASTLLVSCATPESLRTQKPDLSLTSVKSAKEVATCIADKWENDGINATMRETMVGYTIKFVYEEILYFMADVSNSDSGSNTNFYVGFVAYQSKKDIVRDCQ